MSCNVSLFQRSGPIRIVPAGCSGHQLQVIFLRAEAIITKFHEKYHITDIAWEGRNLCSRWIWGRGSAGADQRVLAMAMHGLSHATVIFVHTHCEAVTDHRHNSCIYTCACRARSPATAAGACASAHAAHTMPSRGGAARSRHGCPRPAVA